MVIRVLFKALLICVVLIAVASYLSYLRTGQFWLPSISGGNLSHSMPSLPGNIFSSDSDSSSDGVSNNEAVSIASPTTTTYKWRQNGRWHYGDTPPEGTKAELISKPIK